MKKMKLKNDIVKNLKTNVSNEKINMKLNIYL